MYFFGAYRRYPSKAALIGLNPDAYAPMVLRIPGLVFIGLLGGGAVGAASIDYSDFCLSLFAKASNSVLALKRTL